MNINKAIDKIFEKKHSGNVVSKIFNDRRSFTHVNNFVSIDWINRNFTKSQQDDLALLGVFNEVPELSAPINYISNLAARVKTKIVQINGKNEEKLVNAPDIEKLLNNPNPFYSAINFKRQEFNNFLIFGNNYTNIYKGIGSLRAASMMYTLPTPFVSIIFKQMEYDKVNPDADFRTNEITGYKLEYNNFKLTIPKEEVSHFKDSQINFLYGQYAKGQSRVFAALMATETIKAGYEAKYSYYVNRGALGMFINNDPDGLLLDPIEKQRVLDEFKAKYGLEKGQNLFMFLNHNMTYENIAPDFGGLKILENNEADFGAICMVLNFPPSLLHDKRVALQRLGKEKLQELYGSVICPLVEDYYQKRSIDLGLAKNNIWICPDYSDIECLKQDQSAKEDILKKKLDRMEKLYLMGGITLEMVLESQGIMEVTGKNYYEPIKNEK